MDYPARSIKFALVDASEGKVGSTLDRIVLSCFHYDPTLGAYGPWALGVMRLGGVVTLVLLAFLLAVLWRRETAPRLLETPT